MSLAILFHFLCAQHVSYINISIIRSLRQVVLHPATWIPLQPNHTETPTHIEPRYVQSPIHNNIVY